MVVNGFWPVFWLGVLGGAFAELLKLLHLRTRESLPKYLKSPFYWGVTLAFVAVGGVVATLYGISNVNALLAVNIGASAPLIIAGLARTVPEKTSATLGEGLVGSDVELGTRFHHIAAA